MKICLECAEGGHLDEMLNIIDAFEDHDIFFITTFAETTKDFGRTAKVYYVREQYNAKHRIIIIIIELIYMVKLIFSCLSILLKEKPHVIISTGGGATIPLFFCSKLLGKEIIYIESLARINRPSGTGKIVHDITDLFLVQWTPMLKYYKKAKYWGKVM